MSMLSIQDLCDLTSSTYRTVKNRLASVKPVLRGKEHLYESSEALPLIVARQQTTGQIDIEEQRGRLAFHQANIAEKEEAILDGKFLPLAEVERGWVEIVAGVRSKLLAVPAEVRSGLQPGALNIGEHVEELSRRSIERALKGLLDE